MKLFTIIAMVLISLNASADYFKGGLGYTIGGDAKLESSVADAEDDLDKTFGSPIVLAYGFEMMGEVHGEVELSYRKNDGETDPSEDVTVLAGAFNVVGNAPMGAITLTGGAGITFGTYDVSSFDKKGTAFGLQFFGGADFPINETISVGGEIRYMTTITDFETEVLGVEFDGSYKNTALLFNVKFGM